MKQVVRSTIQVSSLVNLHGYVTGFQIDLLENGHVVPTAEILNSLNRD